MNPFFTIGHSNRDFDAFAALLAQAHIEHLVDVRTVPRSRTNPQFNEDVMPDALGAAGISYEHLAALGGLRGRSKTVPPDENGFWQNESFHHYADYAMTPDFDRGLGRLIERGRRQRCVVMCAEAVWWRCHRRIVADHLLARGFEVLHIMGDGRIDAAQLTRGAVVGDDGMVRYPAG
ncbi:DUF488 domain-containing protein [Alcaligenaceae bacterium]|nr:DUF488 domain-containing protein [Alcaligenaceae bacterium]